MKKSIWKTLFFITLSIFAVVTALVIISIFTLLAQPPSAGTSIIGGADLPTNQFLLAQFLKKDPITYLWFASLLTVVISLIGWRSTKKIRNNF